MLLSFPPPLYVAQDHQLSLSCCQSSVKTTFQWLLESTATTFVTDFTRSHVMLWFSNDVYTSTYLVWTSDLVCHTWVECVFNLPLYGQGVCVCETEVVYLPRPTYESGWCVSFTLGCWNMTKIINLLSLYPTRYLLLLWTCTSCYLSWDRLINVPVINRAFSLSRPWEDLSTYPLKINIPDQWNTHNPATSGVSHPA